MTPVKAPHTPPARPAIVSYVCQPNDFKCVSHPHTCIKSNMVCDGIYDCTDHSDEFNCTREPASKATVGSGTGSGTGTGSGSGPGSGLGTGNFKRWKKSQRGGGAPKSRLRDRMIKRHVEAEKLSRSFGLFYAFFLPSLSMIFSRPNLVFVYGYLYLPFSLCLYPFPLLFFFSFSFLLPFTSVLGAFTSFLRFYVSLSPPLSFSLSALCNSVRSCNTR